MICLGLDTALGACSAALAEGGHVVARRYAEMSTGHAEALAPMVQALMTEAGVPFSALGRVAVTTGPGTFTGQRIGLAFARGLALALKIPCVGVTTLGAIAAAARAAHQDGTIVVIVDARRGEAYVQAFEPGENDAQPALVPFESIVGQLTAATGRLVLAGSAAPLIAARLPGAEPLIAAAVQPDAAHVALMGLRAALTARPPRPLYLRAPDAKLPGPLKPPPAQRRREA